MAQHDYNIANQSGAAFRADLNNALLAIVSQNSGTSAPSTTFAHQFWADTTTGTLKIRNAANSAWIELMQLDGTLTMEDGTALLPGLAFRDDLNTGLFSDAADTLGISTGGVERVEFGTTATVFNDGGADVDFRIEGDTEANLFFVDAGNDRIGLRTSSPATTLDVNGSAQITGSVSGFGGGELRLGPTTADTQSAISTQSTGAPAIIFDHRATSNTGSFIWRNGTGGGSTRMVLDGSGRLGIGATTVDEKLHLEGSSGANTNIKVESTATGSERSSIEFWNGAISRGRVGGDNTFDGLTLDSSTTSGTSVIRFRTAGGSGFNEKARLTADGKLLVGTSSTRYVGAVGAHAVQIEGVGYNQSSLSIVNNENNFQPGYITIGKSRGTSIGSNTVVQNGDVLGNIQFAAADGTDIRSYAAQISAEIDGTPGTDDVPGRLVFSTTGNAASSPTERMRITNDGNVFVNSTSNPALGTEMFGVAAQSSGQTTAAGFANSVNTAPTLFISNTSDTTNTYHVRFASGSGGTTRGEIYYNGSQLVYATSSDYRLKENVEPLSSGVDLVKQLRPVSYRWIESQQEDIGFIAHEVQEVFPNAVGGEKDAVDENGAILPQTYDPSKLVPLLTAALQEALAKIETLEQRLNDAGIA